MQTDAYWLKVEDGGGGCSWGSSPSGGWSWTVAMMSTDTAYKVGEGRVLSTGKIVFWLTLGDLIDFLFPTFVSGPIEIWGILVAIVRCLFSM